MKRETHHGTGVIDWLVPFVTHSMTADAAQTPEGGPTCTGAGKLNAWVGKITNWATREGKTVKHVAGIAAMRVNPETKEREVLLVRGTSETEGPKEAWQFAGGFEKPEDGGNLVSTLVREIREELKQDVPLTSTSYFNSFVPPYKTDAVEVQAIHAFVLPNCTWDIKKEDLGSDVDDFIWTSDPFRNADGTTRLLYPQVDRVLRQLGFEGPKSKNTPPDDYDGDPTK